MGAPQAITDKLISFSKGEDKAWEGGFPRLQYRTKTIPQPTGEKIISAMAWILVAIGQMKIS